MGEALGITIRRLDGGPSLIVEDAASLADAFFSRDPSSTGPNSFDAQAGHGDPDRIATDDIRAINQTMRARSPHTAWEALTSAGPLPWLAALDPSWDLVRLREQDWERFGCTALLEAAFVATIAPYRNLAVTTKVLHFKRPSLFPVLDLLVVQQLGGVGQRPMRLLLHLRAEAQRNRLALEQIQTELEEAHIARTLIRILDALIWSSHPGAGIALTGWERVIRPAGEANEASSTNGSTEPSSVA
jgi:hypothetical protein